MPLRIEDTFRDALAGADRPLAGMWVCSGSPLVAELCERAFDLTKIVDAPAATQPQRQPIARSFRFE